MRVLFWKALVGLLVYDLLLITWDFATLHRTVHKWKVAARQGDEHATTKICEAVNRACLWYPKRALCLQRSSVTTCLLRDGGIPAQMIIGVQQVPFKAHAWVEVNGRVVNERFDIQAVFAVLERC